MITTVKFRLHPTPSQERKLHEIFTIYNRVRGVGCKRNLTVVIMIFLSDQNRTEKARSAVFNGTLSEQSLCK